MKKRNVCLSLLLSILLLAMTCLPAFAATPRVYTVKVTPPDPDAAVVMPEDVTQNIDWDGVVSDAWKLLFTGTGQRSVDIRKYNIPYTDDNIDYLYSYFWYTPRFLRTGMTYSHTSSILTSLNNVDNPNIDFVATDPVQNRTKYDACESAISQLLYGVKDNSDLSGWEQCLLLHDRLAAWAGYNTIGLDSGTLGDDDYSAYGPLALHVGVCNGYALAYNWLLDELGFTTYYESSDYLNHGWSKVELDGELYYVDVTWDDPGFDYDTPGLVMHANFLQSYDAFAAEHDAEDYDQTPSSTIYETGFYQEAVSEIVRINGNYYYFTSNGSLYERLPDGTTNFKFKLTTKGKDFSTNNSYKLWPKLCAVGNTILYLTATDVHAYDPATGADEVVFTPQQTLYPNSAFFLNGIRQLDGTVYVTATDDSNGKFASNTVADYTESFVYCSHPTTDTLSATPGPDCLTPGDAQLICPACRALINGVEQGPVGPHTYTATGTTAPTCIVQGYTSYVCTTCGDSYRADFVPASGHDWQWTVDAEATCNTAGSKHEACTRCDAIRNENTVIPATGNHSYTAQTVSDAAKKADATCTTAAVYYYSCATCGTIEHNDDHTFTNGTSLGHAWTWVVDTDETCNTAGVKHEVCTRCDATQNENTVIPATGNHSYTAQTVSADTLKADATCTTAAVYYYSCATCGTVENNDAHTFTNGTAPGHNWEWVIDAEATCNTAGSKHQKCTRCNETQSENTEIPATGNHSYTEQTVSDAAKKADATCTTAAVYYYSCATCGTVEHNDAHTFTNGAVPGHNWEWAIDREATCNTAGVKHEVCTRCDATQSENTVIPATGNHSYTAPTVSDAAKKADATCTTAATYYYSCATCGTVENNDAHTFTDGASLGHIWTWVTDIEPTCALVGEKHQKCTRCNATQSENTTIPATGNHSYTNQTVSADTLKAAATCDAAAVYYYACATCGMSEQNDAHTFTDGAALGHDWQWVVDRDATCNAAGVKHQKCTRCTATQNADTPIPATGQHAYTAKTVGDDTRKAAATCDTAATYYYSCASCGVVERNDAHIFTDGAALGHDWRETARTNATCSAAGSITYTCTHNSAHTRTETIPQKTHTDANGDGYCDDCGKDLWSGRCAYCGQVHSGAFGWLVKFFHSILAIFKR